MVVWFNGKGRRWWFSSGRDEDGGHQGMGEDKAVAKGHETSIDFKSSASKDYFGLKLCEIYVILKKNFACGALFLF